MIRFTDFQTATARGYMTRNLLSHILTNGRTAHVTATIPIRPPSSCPAESNNRLSFEIRIGGGKMWHVVMSPTQHCQPQMNKNRQNWMILSILILSPNKKTSKNKPCHSVNIWEFASASNCCPTQLNLKMKPLDAFTFVIWNVYKKYVHKCLWRSMNSFGRMPTNIKVHPLYLVVQVPIKLIILFSSDCWREYIFLSYSFIRFYYTKTLKFQLPA